MLILPAIDLLGGACVRLRRGDYGTAHKVAADPIETAREFIAQGARGIHLVDLDGAKAGRRINHELVREIAALAARSGVYTEVGGGIRTMDDVDYYASAGLGRVILGSVALSNPALVDAAVTKHGARIAVGIDARGGYVSTCGWTQDSKTDYLTLAGLMAEAGVDNIIFTDIDRDGMLSGVDYSKYEKLAAIPGVKITASGGVRDIEDIKKLSAMNLYAAICGKSIYEGTLSLTEAINNS